MVDIKEEVIRLAQEGDMGAFEEIYKVYFSLVSNVAYRVVGNVEDAQEVTQDVFMNIYKNIRSFRFEAALKTWVYRITYNSAINHAKRQSKHKKNVEYVEAVSAVESNNIHETIASGEMQQEISRMLAALNPDQRAVIVLRSIEGLSYEEIAQTINIPINTVRSRIKRAREALLAMKKEVFHHEM